MTDSLSEQLGALADDVRTEAVGYEYNNNALLRASDSLTTLANAVAAMEADLAAAVGERDALREAFNIGARTLEQTVTHYGEAAAERDRRAEALRVVRKRCLKEMEPLPDADELIDYVARAAAFADTVLSLLGRYQTVAAVDEALGD
jgi:hypothetical protein